MKQKIIDRIKYDGHLDYIFQRETNAGRNPNDYIIYAEWLNKQSDSDLLDTYERVIEARNNEQD